MVRLVSTCAVAAVLAACGFNPSGSGGDDDGIGPDAGEDGPVDPDASDAPDGPVATCTPRCEQDSFIGCTGNQENEPIACLAGCITTGTPHCGVVQPSNGALASDADGVTDALTIAADRVVIIDSDTGGITSYTGSTPTTVRIPGAGLMNGIRFRVIGQGGDAPDLAMFAVTALTIEDGGALWVAGARPVLLLVRDQAVIAGDIDVGAGWSGPTLTTPCQTCAGAGGGGGATTLVAAGGCAPGLNGEFDLSSHETGGAGGGFGFAGADGGDSDAPGGNASPISGCPGTDLVPLRGGSGGGRGGFDAVSGFGGVGGGGGGGAMQITSLAGISIAATADVYAGGAGGLGSSSDYGGGGGGSGGGFLLEAPTVTVASGARVTANGGGGGSGREANRGENGTRSKTQRASGGAGSGAPGNDGRGGLGGIGGTTSAGATAGSGLVDGTGGGGGGAGIIRVNTVHAFAPPDTAIISPRPATGTAVAL